MYMAYQVTYHVMGEIMNGPADDMTRIHRLLNYSFAGLDITDYIDNFILERKEGLKALLSQNDVSAVLFELDSPEEIAGTICDQYFKDSIKSPAINSGFVTYPLLGWVLQEFSGGRDIGEQHQEVLNRLRQRFEVAHRLFEEYDANTMKKGDSFRTLPNYALLSMVLNLRYLRSGNLNDLNTAVKLNDLLLKSGWPFDLAYSGLIAGAILLEDKIIAGIYV